jgi:putative transposase
MKIDYNNLYIHFVFTTKDRESLILEKYRIRIEKYITGIVNNYASKLYAVYANPDHVHILVSKSPSFSEEQLATVISDSTERFINENKLSAGRFEWQSSASAFSVSKAEVNKICKYILNQPEHHRKFTFTEEYEQFIKFYQDTLLKNKIKS